MYVSGINLGGNSPMPFKHVNKNNSEDKEKRNPNNMLDQLRQQREDIVKKKNALIAKTTEENKPLGSIKEQLKFYNQQIETINSQITAETTAKTKGSVEGKNGDKAKEKVMSSEPKTEEEINNDKLATVAKLGNTMESMKTIDSVMRQNEGEVAVAEQEIKSGQQGRDSFIKNVALLNPTAAETLVKKGLSTQSKEEKLSGLKQRIVELSGKIGEGLGEIQQEIKDSSKIPAKVAGDFLDKYEDWSKDAANKGLSRDNETAFISGKLGEWENNLKEHNPAEYEAWKQITASVDVFA